MQYTRQHMALARGTPKGPTPPIMSATTIEEEGSRRLEGTEEDKCETLCFFSPPLPTSSPLDCFRFPLLLPLLLLLGPELVEEVQR